MRSWPTPRSLAPASATMSKSPTARWCRSTGCSAARRSGIRITERRCPTAAASTRRCRDHEPAMMERKVRKMRKTSFVRRVSLRSLCALRSNVVVAGVAAVLLTASPVFADISVAMHDGRVSIVARDATVRQILTEWARIGQTKIVNVDKIPGGPVTLVLENVTEMHALEILLRPLSGYIAAPRPVAAANLSTYDRIIVLPKLAEARPAMPVSAAASSAMLPSAPPPPVFQQAAPPPAQATDDDQPSEVPGVIVQTAGNAGEPVEMRNPPPNTFQKGLE